ncbi:TolC family protein [Sphingomonas naphthae]|uniref:TolC family protein n=1 Tax=Sphingomonas naphthae TaxID=1813468 RepID=A0ABY7TIR0_9SPHN|nr:TolC family protein [Sphingomonas naphthae]WCT72209.1 TolC family protein [Sphingomonas naphthae]
MILASAFDARRVVRGLPAAFAMLLGGCAAYAPLPLDTAAPPLATAPPFTGPLTIALAVDRALADNPDLRAARMKHGVAQAQRVQAGVLPNPSLAGAILPLLSGAGTVPAWNIALSQDIKSLITYRSKRRAAQDAAAQVDADILWQEWQVAGQARQITLDLIEGERTRPLLLDAFALLRERNRVMRQALAAGDATLVTASPSLVAFGAARTALDQLDQKQLQLRHQLNALLGLAPDVMLPLAAQADLPPFDPVSIRADLATLADRRPDLLALQLGYQAQEEAVRQAILMQFPDLVLGGSVASDNSKVINGGPQATIGLPIFDRNQGNIAIARATRAQLRAEYAARIAATEGEVRALLAQREQLAAQLAVARRDLPAIRTAAQRASAAFGDNLLDERAYVDLVIQRFTREQEIAALDLALRDREVAIQTLIGAGLPAASTIVPPGASQ